MATLEELRIQLDEIDNQIVKLYEDRMEICKQVGEYKVHTGKKVLDKQREKNKLADVASKVTNDFNKKGIQELYEQLMSMSRKLQYRQLVSAGATGRLPFIELKELEKTTARVVYQGVEGAYGQAALKNYFGENNNYVNVHTFRDAMEALEDGVADYAVLPIENSTAGAVNEVYDLLVEFENYIIAETIIPITHTLSGLAGTELKDIKKRFNTHIVRGIKCYNNELYLFLSTLDVFKINILEGTEFIRVASGVGSACFYKEQLIYTTYNRENIYSINLKTLDKKKIETGKNFVYYSVLEVDDCLYYVASKKGEEPAIYCYSQKKKIYQLDQNIFKLEYVNNDSNRIFFECSRKGDKYSQTFVIVYDLKFSKKHTIAMPSDFNTVEFSIGDIIFYDSLESDILGWCKII